jgi:hypothetical protein
MGTSGATQSNQNDGPELLNGTMVEPGGTMGSGPFESVPPGSGAVPLEVPF